MHKLSKRTIIIVGKLSSLAHLFQAACKIANYVVKIPVLYTVGFESPSLYYTHDFRPKPLFKS